MRATRPTLAAAALAAATFLLTGCEPVTITSGPSSSDGRGVDCDPNGFGPLSGCHGASSPDQQQAVPETTTNTPAPAKDDSAESETPPCKTDPGELDLGAGRFDGADGCDSGQDTGYDSHHGGQQITETTTRRYTVTVTWIVVSIDFTGFRECVLGLQEAPAKSDDPFSRRITTTDDCEAQQVHTVYRPVADTGK